MYLTVLRCEGREEQQIKRAPQADHDEPRVSITLKRPTQIRRFSGAPESRRHCVCWSLERTHFVGYSGRHLAACPMDSRCAGQTRVVLFIDGHPWRLLLALTSARNVIVHEALSAP